MKPRSLQIIAVASVLLANGVLADESRVAAYTAQFRGVRVTEIAREAAKLITAEQADARIAATADAVTAAVSVSSPSAPLVVGALSKAAPETAATAAGTALKLEPKPVSMITKAAVSAAPDQIAAIVGSMCKAQPTAFYKIGVSAAEAAPKASDKVLPAITTALPALKPLVARAQADFVAAKRPASLALVLKHTENLLAALSGSTKESTESLLTKESEATMATKIGSLAAGPPPVLLPPFVPGGGTPGEINTGDTPVTSSSGRVYSPP